MTKTILRPILYAIFLVANTTYVATVQATINNPAKSLPTLPQQYLETRYQSIRQSFEERASLFLKGRPFHHWTANKPDADILNEFKQINEWRDNAWYVDPNANTLISRNDFLVAQDLLEKGLYRKPGILAFEYNRTDGSYNSSTVILNGFKFLALEAPTSQNLRQFYLLLQNHRVTQLVRLSHEKDLKNFAYWQGQLKTQPNTNASYLSIPTRYNFSPYALRYYSVDHWAHNTSIPPQTLLKLIQQLRSDFDPNGLIACHSSDGAGRTGTFIAGFLILNEIDRQLSKGVSKDAIDLSIEKIVMQLALQRPHLVQTAEQYKTLYRLVDLYLK